MKIKLLFTLLSAGLIAAGSTSASVVFSDNFESSDVDSTDNTVDGDGVSGADGWDRTLSSGSSSFTAVNDGTLGNAGLLDNKGNQTFGFVAVAFTPQTLASTGDSITLTFDFRFVTLANANNGANFRFGLWNATSGIDISGGANYWGRLATNGTGSLALFEGADSYPGSEFGTLATGDTFNITNTAKYSASFAVTKTATGVIVAYEYFNSSGTSIGSLAFEDTVSPYTTFDALGFRTNLANNMAFDNIEVDFTAVPEPSTYAMFAGLLALGLAMVRRRLR
jgi:hypothetical protein